MIKLALLLLISSLSWTRQSIYKNLRNIENDLSISRKYGGHIFNKYHIRFLIMKLIIMTKLIFLLEIVRRIRWKIKGIDYA